MLCGECVDIDLGKFLPFSSQLHQSFTISIDNANVLCRQLSKETLLTLPKLPSDPLRLSVCCCLYYPLRLSLVVQVTRQHLKLHKTPVTNAVDDRHDDVTDDHRKTRRALATVTHNASDSCSDLNDLEDVQSVTDRGRSSRRNQGTPINAFEHRHKAQQRILEQQQKQLSEQRRLIEDMQALQRQQLLQQQLGAVHQRQASASQAVQHDDGKRNFQPTHLHNHLANMQSELADISGRSESRAETSRLNDSPDTR